MLIPSQQRALETVTEQPGVALLIGGPGTGKTFTVAHLLKQQFAHGHHSVAVAAPTGKAALRLCEQFDEHDVIASASTIHTLLGVEEVSDEGFRFFHGPLRPLPVKTLIIDEFSMVSTPLAATLFGAIAPGTKVICVGDVHQLPPVEHGAPLRDMIASRVIPVGELTEIRRNSGRIVQACKEIRETGTFRPGTEIDIANGENLLHIEQSSPGLVKSLVKRLFSSPPAGVDPIKDIQVVVTCNDKGDLCREAINSVLQNFLNPDGQTSKGCDLRVNDKVICNKNRAFLTTDSDLIIDEENKTYVANGELGVVIAVSDAEIYVRLDTGSIIMAKGADRKFFDLAYALTTHKSQGSQWKIVIYVSDEYGGARRVGCRELIYTAISRAQTLAITIGRFETIRRDLRRVAITERKTFLKEMLQEA